MAAFLALLSAMCFTLAATLQQLGQFVLAQTGSAVQGLARAMAAVSVSNPAISVLLGILLFQERLTRPGWHVVVAGAALLAALGGAVLITLANRETTMPGLAPGMDGACTDAALA